MAHELANDASYRGPTRARASCPSPSSCRAPLPPLTQEALRAFLGARSLSSRRPP